MMPVRLMAYLLALLPIVMCQSWYPPTMLAPPSDFMTFYRQFTSDNSWIWITTTGNMTISLPMSMPSNSYTLAYGLLSFNQPFNNARFQTTINKFLASTLYLSFKVEVESSGVVRNMGYSFLIVNNSYMATKSDFKVTSSQQKITLSKSVSSTNVSISFFYQSIWRKIYNIYASYPFFPSYFNINNVSHTTNTVNISISNYTGIDSMMVSCLMIDLMAIPTTRVISIIVKNINTASYTTISTGINLTMYPKYFMGFHEFRYPSGHQKTVCNFTTVSCNTREIVGMKALFFANIQCPNTTVLNLDNPQQPKCMCTEQSSSCTLCHFSCNNCTNTTATSCTTCSSGSNRDLTAGSCVCMAGFYENNVSVCPSCNPALNCMTCTNGTACATCDATLYRQMETTTKACICPEGRYDSMITNTCEICPIRCRSCIDDLVCTACAINSNRDLLNDCQCYPGYFDNGNANCSKCNDTCANCEVVATNCTECDVIHNRELVNGSCQCLVAHYNNDSSQVECYPCSNGCLVCPNADDCTTCKAGYYKNGTVCELSNNIQTDVMLGVPKLNEHSIIITFSAPVKFVPDITTSISLCISGIALNYSVSTPPSNQYSRLVLIFNKTVSGSPLIMNISQDTVFSLEGSKVLYSPYSFNIQDYYEYTPPEVVGMRQLTGTVAVVAEGSQYGRSMLMVPGMIFLLTDLLEFIQIISYCIFLDIDLPANVKMILECFYEASSLNFLPDSVKPPLPANPPVKRPYLYEFYDFSYSFIQDNFVGISTMTFYTLGFIALWLLAHNQRKNRILAAIRRHYRNTLYANLSGNYLTCFLPLGFAAVVCIRNNTYRTWLEASTYAAAWTFVFLCLVVVFMHPVMLYSTKKSQTINTEECYGQVSRQCPHSEKYIFSRLLLLFTILTTIPLCSPMTSLCLMFVCCAYHLRCGIKVTFHSKYKKAIRMSYVSIHMMIMLFLIVFAAKEQFKMSQQQIAYLGYATIGLILINLILQTSMILWEMGEYLYTKIQDFIKNYRQKRIIKIKDPKAFENLRQKRKEKGESKMEPSEVTETKYPLATTRQIPSKKFASPAPTPRQKNIKRVKATTFDLVQYSENYH